MIMAVKKAFTGTKELGFSNFSIKIESFGKEIKIEINEHEWESDSMKVIILDIDTAVQFSKEVRRSIAESKNLKSLK